MRTTAEMTPVEQAQHRNWTMILKAETSSDAEKKNARTQLDALEWQSHSGPLMAQLTKLTKRLDMIEAEGQSMTEADRKALKELREISGQIDQESVSNLQAITEDALKAIEETATMQKQHHVDMQAAWSKHELALVEAKKERESIGKRLGVIEEVFNNKFREIEKAMADLVAKVIEEAETAIQAEAHQAALEAVSDLVGDESPDEPDVEY